MYEALFAFLFLIAGLYIYWHVYGFRKDGISVEVKVIGQKLDWSATALTFNPVFEITSGEYIGKSAKSKLGTSFGFHTKGALLEGLYHPGNGQIESLKILYIMQVTGQLLIFGGLIYFLVNYIVLPVTT